MNKLNEQRWKLHIMKENKLFLLGLKNNEISVYDEDLINSLRETTY